MLTAFMQGVTVVSADNFNSFDQTCDNLSELRNFTGGQVFQVYVRGTDVAGDGGQGAFYWNSTSTATDNNSTVIVPNGQTTGAWIRLSQDAATLSQAETQLYAASVVGTPTAPTVNSVQGQVAIGSGAVSSGSGVNAIAIGTGYASGANSIAIQIGSASPAYGSQGTYSVVFGYQNLASNGSTYIGIFSGSSNTIGNGASNSFIGGGTANSISGSSTYSVILGGNGNSLGPYDNASSIVGGTGNTIPGGAVNSIIAGGNLNEIENAATGSAILGGTSNSIVGSAVASCVTGGSGNLLFSSYSTLIGGSGNSALYASAQGITIIGGSNNIVAANSSNATIVGGTGNSVSGTSTGSTIVGGSGNTINGAVNSTALGSGVVTSNSGQLSYANGYRSAAGDSQCSLYVYRGTTTSTSATQIYLDGSSAQLAVQSGQAISFRVQAVAHDTTTPANNASLYSTVNGLVYNNGGGSLALSGPTMGVTNLNSWTVGTGGVSFSSSGTNLVCNVTSPSSDTVHWVVSIWTVEVTA